MTKVVALHCIHMRDPDAPGRFTGEYDNDGFPIIRPNKKIIMPETEFVIDDPALLARLLKQKAVCKVEDYHAPMVVPENRWPKSFAGA